VTIQLAVVVAVGRKFNWQCLVDLPRHFITVLAQTCAGSYHVTNVPVTQELYSTYNSEMAAKLGLQSHDQALTTELLTLMAQSEADWTNTFRALAHIPSAATSSNGSSSSSAAGNNGSSSSSSSSAETNQAQQQQQPLASTEAAVDAALAAGLPQRLVDALSAEQLQQQPQLVESWAAWLRVWQGRLAEEGLPDEQRMAMQMAASPKFVPRQHLLQVRMVASWFHFVPRMGEKAV
jgi:uncharacterized protein YdiU (UPF0061 family)